MPLLHLEDLALAAACCRRLRSSLGTFRLRTYRGYLRSAAARDSPLPARVRRKPANSRIPFSRSFMDSPTANARERSLFRYFHGRSSLKTWLRAVLAQRHIDSIRAGRRFESLGEDDVELPTRSESRRAAPCNPPILIANVTSLFSPARCRRALRPSRPRKKSASASTTPRKKPSPKSASNSANMNPASRAIWIAAPSASPKSRNSSPRLSRCQWLRRGARS